MKRFYLYALTAFAILGITACNDAKVVPEENPPQPPQPSSETKWNYTIGNLLQTPQASKVFTNVCPVFSPDGQTAYFQSDNKNIIAVDVRSGSIKWQTNSNQEIGASGNGTPTQLVVNPVNGEIYANCHITDSEKNVFFALDPGTGKITKKLADAAILGSNLCGPAVSADGKVVYIGTYGATLRAVSTEDFSLIGSVALLNGFRGAVAEGNKVIALTNYDEVRIMTYNPDATDGFVFRYSAPISGYEAYAVTTSYPCLSPDGRSFYFPAANANVFGGMNPTEGYIVRLDLGTMKFSRCTVAGATHVWNVFADKEGCVYATCKSSVSSQGAFIRKYSADLNSVLWTWTVPSAGLSWSNGLNRSTPAMDANGNIYVLSREDSAIYKIDGTTGEGAKLLDAPEGANIGGCQHGVNIAGGYLVTAFSGANSGILAGVEIGANRGEGWSSAGGDLCGSKCYERVWGKPSQIEDCIIPSEDQNVYMFDAKPASQLRQDMLDYIDQSVKTLGTDALSAELSNLKASVLSKMNEPFAWIDQVNSFVTRTIRNYAPAVDDARVEPSAALQARRILLTLRDYPMHVVSISDVVDMEPGQADAFNESVEKFFGGAVDNLMEWLKTPYPEEGKAEIFKIYNMGYVVRTHNHCFGIDIHFWGTDAQRTELAKHLEALFVTHAHGDHFDVKLMTEMSGIKGKYLFMTSNTSKNFTSKDVATVCKWDGNEVDGTDVNGMTVRAAIGAQGTEPCQLFYTESDGFHMWFAGDNGQESAYQFASTMFQRPHVTMLSAAGNVSGISSYAKKAMSGGTRETVYIISHENEVHHQISGRVSYKFFFKSNRRMLDKNFCNEVGNFAALDCGEIITIGYSM